MICLLFFHSINQLISWLNTQAPIKLIEYSNSVLNGIHAISSTQVVVCEDHKHIPANYPSKNANGHANGHAPIDVPNGHALRFVSLFSFANKKKL